VKIRLVVTGDCEEAALHHALQNCFPDARFDRPHRVDSFTSTPLRDPPSPGCKDTLDKFTHKLVELTDEDDALVIGVDDQELHDNPANLAHALRQSVQRKIEEFASSLPSRERLAQKLRERCSFHLLVPMVEAYFFCDPKALKQGGAIIESRFDSLKHDVEDFVVDDVDYMTAPETTAESEPNKERRKRSWAKAIEVRRRHPKHYLKYLSSPHDPFGSQYKETKHGADALRSLDWTRVLAEQTHVRSVRALLNDIADFLSWPPFAGNEVQDTSRSAPRRASVLRNL
jgi:hypothetical protein